MSKKAIEIVLSNHYNFSVKPLYLTEVIVEFTDYISQERTRLEGERQKVLGEINTLGVKRNEIDREMAAIDAYEDAKNGRADRHQTTRGHTGQSPRARTRMPRGSRREGIMSVIRDAGSTGLKRGEILEKLGLTGDKSGAMSVSNALTALLKAQRVDRKNGGKYVANG